MSFQLIPYIMLDGQAEEAIQFYEQTLGAKLLFKQTFGEGPQNPDSPLKAEEAALVAHAILKIGDTQIFVADCIPGLTLQEGNLLTICLTTDDSHQAKQFYQTLQQGGQVILPLEEAYFSPAYGMVKDKFGVSFQIFTKRQ
ncbi:VOC family protein [Paenibacillus sp. GCM10012306]|uniref:VOC family protein n=1 Tax=Paenibacillus sp. GCM10012306 TaxID=3317342 RepID=UPI00361C6BE3